MFGAYLSSSIQFGSLPSSLLSMIANRWVCHSKCIHYSDDKNGFGGGSIGNIIPDVLVLPCGHLLCRRCRTQFSTDIEGYRCSESRTDDVSCDRLYSISEISNATKATYIT
ncbi:hypothetical protein PFISCL1PPCAC_12377, partial [Pristionchus fissidentatus]